MIYTPTISRRDCPILNKQILIHTTLLSTSTARSLIHTRLSGQQSTITGCLDSWDGAETKSRVQPVLGQLQRSHRRQFQSSRFQSSFTANCPVVIADFTLMLSTMLSTLMLSSHFRAPSVVVHSRPSAARFRSVPFK